MKNLVFSLSRPYRAVFGAFSAISAAYKGGGGRCLIALRAEMFGGA
ncbi:MAG: hypothetical protein ACR2QC_08935 [Gammaproteobacteria bacterium]